MPGWACAIQTVDRFAFSRPHAPLTHGLRDNRGNILTACRMSAAFRDDHAAVITKLHLG